jgi:putative transposase
MSDMLYTGKRFRTFNVIDDFNREVIHIEIDTSLTGRRLIRVLERLRLERRCLTFYGSTTALSS